MATPNDSQLDIHQVLRKSFNVDNQTLRLNTFVPEAFDYVGKDNTSATEETFTYKMGGSSGTTVAVVLVTYSDGTKADLVSVERIS